MTIMQTLAHTKFVNLVNDIKSNWVWAQRRSEDIAGGVQVAAIVDTKDLHQQASAAQNSRGLKPSITRADQAKWQINSLSCNQTQITRS